MPPLKRPRILVVSLGGTITMTRGASGGMTPTLSATELLGAVARLDEVAAVETVSPMTLPSASLTIDDVLGVSVLIDQRLSEGLDGIVLVQGTDTIEETAFLLDLVLRSEKPVVVTGAMRGPEAPGADGPANILAATIVAAAPQAAGLGTLVVLNDEIHAARFVQKSHTALPSAFTSSPSGPLGLVAEGRPRLHARVPPRTSPIAYDIEARVDAPVALIRMSLGDDGRMLRMVGELGYRGLVIEGMGAGHVPASVVPLVSDLAATMPVVLASRVHAGPAFTATYGFSGSEMDLLRRGVIPAGNLRGLKARLLLSLLLRNQQEPGAVASAFAPYS